MADLFTKMGAAQTKEDDVQSEAGDAPFAATGPKSFGGVFREDAQAKVQRGRGPVPVDKRKFRYDVVRGRGANRTFSVSRDDRMDAVEAGAMLNEIHKMFGIEKENEDFLYAFDSGLFFCHTVNGGSVLNPGRSKFNVDAPRVGGSGEAVTVFDYEMVRDKLGVAFRRFFRAFADEVTDVNKRVLKDYDPYIPESKEQWGWLMEVAHERGLHRYPHLAHDSADACLNLNVSERQALKSSKQLVIGATPNSADKMRPSGGTASADKFDSSVGDNY